MISILYYSAVQSTEKVLTGIGEEPDFGFSPDFLYKILLAIVAGLLIGIEREYKGKDAGPKTNMLVSVGACAFVILSLQYQGGAVYRPHPGAGPSSDGYRFPGRRGNTQEGGYGARADHRRHCVVQCRGRVHSGFVPGHRPYVVHGGRRVGKPYFRSGRQKDRR